MRLSSIKLSGFKSFADPTHFQLPGQLVGVVGPNGCGKSNIIDAVRWVLGESRASELRGESMQDVIFNGSTSRKPASRASVELVFDNSSHRAGGQWNTFEEIAVRRVLTRDGNSSYYINTQAVRRRDVQDVFLGTGLGPRAYAIIGQGTISRIIESRPEELRLFLEEAAGVSKYKERRRETENRIQDTEENLTRVSDILRELNSNLEKLESQAQVAEQYQGLHAKVTLRQQQQWFLKHAQNMQEQTRLQADVTAAGTKLEESMSDLRRAQADMEAIRQAHYAAGDELNGAQGFLYEASAEVGRLEAEIRFVVDGRKRTQERLQQIVEQLKEWQARLAQSKTEQESLSGQQAEQSETSAILEAQLAEHGDKQEALQSSLQAAKQKAGEQLQGVHQVQSQIQVLAAQQRHVDEQSRHLQVRSERMALAQRELQAPEETRLTALQQEVKLADARAQQAHQELEAMQVQLPLLDEARLSQTQAAQAQHVKLGQLSAHLDALQKMQAQVISNDRLKPWLETQGLSHLSALWTRVHVDTGWEVALEAALRERMGALEVSRLDALLGLASSAPPAKLCFYDAVMAEATGGSEAQTLPAGLQRLMAVVRINDAAGQQALAHWLHSCLTAPDLKTALAARAQLSPQQSIYTPQGHVVSAHSLSFYAPEGEQAGLLARAQEIENLEKSVRAENLIAQEQRAAQQRAESDYAQAAQALQLARQSALQAQNHNHDLQLQLANLSQQVQEARSRGEQIAQEQAEVDEQLQTLQEQRVTLEAQFENLDMQLADTQERQAALDEVSIRAEQDLNAWHEQVRSLERARQESEFSQRSLQAKTQELLRNVTLGEQQIASLTTDQSRLGQDLEQFNDLSAQTGLQAALSVKLEREALLASRRSQYDDLSLKLRACDERRLSAERSLEPMRNRISDLQLKEQAARLGAEQYAQLLQDAKADLAALRVSVDADNVRLGGLQSEIETLNQNIAALGAINLAALDELKAARERKTFLDAQSSDLLEAMSTLQDAIRKIDAETRELLAKTFEQVNHHFGEMFPKLFAGGQAKLLMTGDEILDTGIQVMAQPPGKKNQTIHLLSGGEKALTAIALVFAIFMLNPAPFCLLDEVDAPLDDANTERYAKLVGNMSKETQFLFISHNKIAMEMAQQLVGVTMQEQGVSRIVAVDMEAATQLVNEVVA